MAFRSRLAGLAAAAALAFPAAGLIATLPGTAAEASTGTPTFACQAEQAAIHFINGAINCQDYGRVTYIALRDGERIRQICAGGLALAQIDPYELIPRPVFPNKCELVSAYPLRTDVTVSVVGF